VTNFTNMRVLAMNIVKTVEKKDADYGSSWRKREGIGAFMVMSRKWDRIENICKQLNYDIFKALAENKGDIKDDIDDLIGYLLLIREHCDTVRDTAGKQYGEALDKQAQFSAVYTGDAGGSLPNLSNDQNHSLESEMFRKIADLAGYTVEGWVISHGQRAAVCKCKICKREETFLESRNGPAPCLHPGTPLGSTEEYF